MLSHSVECASIGQMKSDLWEGIKIIDGDVWFYFNGNRINRDNITKPQRSMFNYYCEPGLLNAIWHCNKYEFPNVDLEPDKCLVGALKRLLPDIPRFKS